MIKVLLFYLFVPIVVLAYGGYVYELKSRHDRKIVNKLESAQQYFTENPTATSLPNDKAASSSPAGQGDVQNAGSEALPTNQSDEHPAAAASPSPGNAIVYDDNAFNGNAPAVSPRTPAGQPSGGGDQLPSSNGDAQPASNGTPGGAAPTMTDLLPGAPNPSGVGTASSTDHLPTSNNAPADNPGASGQNPGATASADPNGSGAATLPPAGDQPTQPSGAGTMTLSPQGNPAGAVGNGQVYVLCYYQIVNGSPGSNMYAISAKSFETQMASLKKNGYTVVSFPDFQKYLRKETTLPPKSVVITIDGGFRNAITIAKPILAKHGYPWAFFVYTDFIGSGEDKATWQDLTELEATGFVDVQSHSRTPSNLTLREKKSQADYEAWAMSEMTESKKVLEEKLNKKITAMAYPYGDYNEALQQKAQQAGYEFLLCVSDNPVDGRTVPADISRIPVFKPTEKLFDSLVKEAVMPLTDITPAPGKLLTDRRPVISAVGSAEFNPRGLKATVEGEDAKISYDPGSHALSITLDKDLEYGTVKIGLTGQDAQTKQPLVYNWQFTVQKGAPAPAADAAPSKPAGEKTSAKPKKKDEAKPKKRSNN